MIHALSYGDGKIRTYPADDIDGRLAGTPLITKKEMILRHLRNNTKPILISVRHAQSLFGWKQEDFA
jgi:hypothetical protein